jgi:hypothetical protein
MELRVALFFGVCIPLRVLVACLASMAAPYVALPLILPPLCWLYYGLVAPRPTGVFGPSWWARFRPLHGILYAGAAGAALVHVPAVRIFLLLDVLVALVAHWMASGIGGGGGGAPVSPAADRGAA